MNKVTNQKRLKRIQAALWRSTDAGDMIMVYELFDVPDFDHAVKRAREVEANHVIFVPLRGAVQDSDVVPDSAKRTHATAVAFAGRNPKDEQLRRLVKWGERSGQGAERTIVVSGQPLESESEAGRRGSVSFQYAGKVLMRVNVDPSELP